MVVEGDFLFQFYLLVLGHLFLEEKLLLHGIGIIWESLLTVGLLVGG